MDLVRTVLAGVSDGMKLSDHKAGPTPLHRLLKLYEEKASRNDAAPNPTPDFTGADLKNGIEKLSVEDQVELVYGYLENCNRLAPIESPAEVEDRKLKHLAVKIFLWGSLVVILMLFGAVTAIAVRTGALPSNEVVSTFLEFAGDIVDVIWEAK